MFEPRQMLTCAFKLLKPQTTEGLQ